MAIQTTRWDSAEYLKTNEDIQLYLEACLEESEDDPELLLHALNVVARAKTRQSTVIDTEASLPENLGSDDEPTFLEVVKVLKSLGFKLTIQPTA